MKIRQELTKKSFYDISIIGIKKDGSREELTPDEKKDKDILIGLIQDCLFNDNFGFDEQNGKILLVGEDTENEEPYKEYDKFEVTIKKVDETYSYQNMSYDWYFEKKGR